MYEALKCKVALLNRAYTVYGLEDVVLILLHMYKNGATANRAMTELSITLRDDKNISIPTSQWLLGMISAIDSNKMDALYRCMLESTIKKGSGLERKTC